MERLSKIIFLEYAKERHFSKSLIEKCLLTLENSIRSGDGALWTDSLLWTLIQSSDSMTGESISKSIGIRGDLISDFSFSDTLETQCLEFSPFFQTPIDTSLQLYCRTHPEEEVNEDTLMLIELQDAIENYGHEHTYLVEYVVYLLALITEHRISIDREKSIDYLLSRFEDRFSDAFILASMACQHPLDAFDSDNSSLEVNYRTQPIQKKFLRFLIYLRDAVHLSPVILPDDLLVKSSKRWNEEFYQDVEMEEESYHDADRLCGEVAFDSGCLYAASKLAKYGVSLPGLLERLQHGVRPPVENNWSQNEALLLHLSNGRIQALPTDLIGVHKIQNERAGSIIERAGCGLIVPNPIWNESVIDRLEYLINQPKVKEQDLQMFFEMYPDFILSDLHTSAIPQVVLYKDTGNKTLRPDFILKRESTNYIDIVELKRPSNKVVTGTNDRPFATRDLAKAIAQLKEYGEWFRSMENRKWFRDRYGLEGYEPNLTLIIGRQICFRNERIRKHIVSSSGVNILTYDDLLKMAKVRRARTFGR